MFDLDKPADDEFKKPIIYGSVDGIVAHIGDQGCPYALHAASLEIVRRLARIDVERFGEDNCPGQLKMLETIESLRG